MFLTKTLGLCNRRSRSRTSSYKDVMHPAIGRSHAPKRSAKMTSTISYSSWPTSAAGAINHERVQNMNTIKINVESHERELSHAELAGVAGGNVVRILAKVFGWSPQQVDK